MNLNDFLEVMAEILEEDSIESSDILEKFPSWDSLSILSVIEISSEKFNKTISGKSINQAKTIEDLFNLLNS